MSARSLPLLALAGACLGASAAPPPAQSQTRSFRVDAPCSQVFPLFTAEGERAWAPGWDPEPLSGGVTRGSVFRTEAHGRETVWVVTDYDPAAHRVSYARLAEGSNMGLVDVRCTAAGEQSSEVQVTYTLTGLGPEGRAFVQDFLSEGQYGPYIEEWREAIAAHLGRQP